MYVYTASSSPFSIYLFFLSLFLFPISTASVLHVFSMYMYIVYTLYTCMYMCTCTIVVVDLLCDKPQAETRIFTAHYNIYKPEMCKGKRKWRHIEYYYNPRTWKEPVPKATQYIGVEKERDNITHNGPQWGGSGGLCGVPSVMANSLVYIRQT